MAIENEITDHTTAKFHLWHNRRLILTVLILTEAYVCFGYDASVIGGLLAMPAFIRTFGTTGADGQRILTASQVSVITATRTSCSVPAVFVCSYFGNKIGRKKTILLGSAICLCGTAIQTGSINEAMITVGLWVASFGYFVMVSMASPLIIEITPPSVRGMAGALSVVAIGISSVLSSGIAWGTYRYASDLSFRLPLGLQNIFPIIISVCMIYVMDSPTSYLINGDDTHAEESLRLVRGGYTELELQQEMDILKRQAHLRKEEVEVKWHEIFTGVDLRRTMLATFLGIIQNFSGGVFSTNYATIFLNAVGTADPFLLVFGLNILILGGSIVGILLVDSIGRRPLLLLSFLSLGIIDLIIGCLGFADTTNDGVVQAIAGFSLLFGFVLAVGISPLTWLIAAEMPTARLRNVSNAWVLLCISLSNLAVNYVMPFIANEDAANLGPKTFLIFAFCMLLGLVVSWFYWPETKGRSPAELDEMFALRLPARKFKSYNTTVIADSREARDAGEGTVAKDGAANMEDKMYM